MLLFLDAKDQQNNHPLGIPVHRGCPMYTHFVNVKEQLYLLLCRKTSKQTQSHLSGPLFDSVWDLLAFTLQHAGLVARAE